MEINIKSITIFFIMSLLICGIGYGCLSETKTIPEIFHYNVIEKQPYQVSFQEPEYKNIYYGSYICKNGYHAQFEGVISFEQERTGTNEEGIDEFKIYYCNAYECYIYYEITNIKKDYIKTYVGSTTKYKTEYKDVIVTKQGIKYNRECV